MNSRLTIRRSGRAAAVVGAVVAISATILMALVAGPASASEPGRCVENVNVRALPDATSRIVALCEAGTTVQVGEVRNGFVRLTDLGGWSAQEYVSVNGAAPAAPTAAPAPAAAPRPAAGAAPNARSAPAPSSARSVPTTAAPSQDDDTATGNRSADGNESAAPTSHPAPRTFPHRTPAPSAAPEPAPNASPVGGLLP